MKKPAFSLVELLVSVMVISIIAVAFAPIVTKRIKTGLVSIKNEPAETPVKMVTKSKLFLTNTEGCTNNTLYIKCNFTVPDNVTELNAVIVGGGSGGAGAVTGTSLVQDRVLLANAINPSMTVYIDDSTMSNLKLELAIGGGGGGGGANTYTSGSTTYYKTGKPGSSGGVVYDFDIPKSTSYGTLKQIRLSAGAGGTGGAKGEDGSNGNPSTLYMVYEDASNNETIVTAMGNSGCGGGGANNTNREPASSWSGGSCMNGYYTNVNWTTYTPSDPGSGSNDGSVSTTGWPAAVLGGGQDLSVSAYPFGWGGSSANSLNGIGEPGGFGGVKVTYTKAFSGAGAASGGGFSGSMSHITKVKVTPGEQCTIFVGKGGAGGDTGSVGGKGGPSYFGCDKLGFASNGDEQHGGVVAGAGYPSNSVNSAQVGIAETETSAAVQGYLYFETRGMSGDFGQIDLGSDIQSCTGYQDKYASGGYDKFLMFNYVDPMCTYDIWSYYSSGYSPVSFEAGKTNSQGAQGANGMKSSVGDETACGGLNSSCGNSSVNGQTLPFKAPTVEGIKAGNYGSAGAGGGGGGWMKRTNTAGKGGNGQDGYVFIYWDEAG